MEMDVLVRREHLETCENPNAKLDYVIAVSGNIANLCGIGIRYIPDRVILTPASIALYFEMLGRIQWSSLEKVAAAIVADLNNELIPRWVQVTINGTSAELTHRVTIEDRQPKWDNPALLARIAMS